MRTTKIKLAVAATILAVGTVGFAVAAVAGSNVPDQPVPPWHDADTGFADLSKMPAWMPVADGLGGTMLDPLGRTVMIATPSWDYHGRPPLPKGAVTLPGFDPMSTVLPDGPGDPSGNLPLNENGEIDMPPAPWMENIYGR